MRFKACLISALVFLTGCSVPQMVPHVTEVKPASDKVVVIGRFVLTPPVLTELEQKTHWNVIGDDRIINTLFMSTGGANKPAEPDLIGKGWQATIETQWGQPFMIELERRRTWLTGGVMFLDALKQERLWFPGGAYFDVPADAEAVYIGTLHYIRNEFNTIKGVEIVDEYTATLEQLSLNRAQVTKSLLQVPSQKERPVQASNQKMQEYLLISFNVAPE